MSKKEELIIKYYTGNRKWFLNTPLTQEELLFLIPNNIKRRYGLPAARTPGRNKARTKTHKQLYLLTKKSWDELNRIIDEMFEKIAFKKADKFFMEFVDFKNVDILYSVDAGNDTVYVIPTNNDRPIKVVFEE